MNYCYTGFSSNKCNDVLAFIRPYKSCYNPFHEYCDNYNVSLNNNSMCEGKDFETFKKELYTTYVLYSYVAQDKLMHMFNKCDGTWMWKRKDLKHNERYPCKLYLKECHSHNTNTYKILVNVNNIDCL